MTSAPAKAPRKAAAPKTTKPKTNAAKAKLAPVTPELAAPVEESPAPAPPIAAPEPPTPVCPHCREPNAPGARFCRHCGGAIDGSLTPPTHLPPTAPGYQPQYGYSEPPAPNRTPWIVAAAILGVLAIAGLYYMVFIADDVAEPAASTTPAVTLPSATTKVEEQYFVISDANVRDRPTSVGTQVVRKENRGSMLRGSVEIGEDNKTQWLKLSDNSGYVAMSNLSSSQPPRLAQTFSNRPFTSSYDIQLHAAPDDSSPVLETMPYGKTIFLAGITDNGFVEAKRSKGGVGYFNASGVDLSSNAVVPPPMDDYSARDAVDYDPDRGISVDYLSGYSSLTGRTGDQQISITIRGDGSGVAYYTNVDTGKACTAYLRYTGVYGNYLGFNQSRPSDGSGCGQTPELRLSGNPGRVQADWVMNGSYVMSTGLRQR